MQELFFNRTSKFVLVRVCLAMWKCSVWQYMWHCMCLRWAVPWAVEGSAAVGEGERSRNQTQHTHSQESAHHYRSSGAVESGSLVSALHTHTAYAWIRIPMSVSNGVAWHLEWKLVFRFWMSSLWAINTDIVCFGFWACKRKGRTLYLEVHVSEANQQQVLFCRLFSKARFHYPQLAPARAFKGLRTNGFVILYLCYQVLMAQSDACLIVSWYRIARDLEQLQCSIKMSECHFPCVSMWVLDFFR